MNPKTSTIKSSDVSREWHIIDASQAPLGRVATVIANKLIGKHKPSYTPHIDNGDFVVVVNTDKLFLTGNKASQKKYYRHSQYPGSLKTTTLEKRMVKDSTGIIEDAVKGMLPKNKLQDGRMARLKVYSTQEHPHTAQSPKTLEIK